MYDTHGAVNTGKGTQNVYIAAPSYTPPREGLRMAREERERLVALFVPPARFGVAVERIAKPGSTVLLDGPPGAGRHAAATVMLCRIRGTSGVISELTLDRAEEDDRLPLSPGQRYTIDLSRHGADQYTAVERSVRAYRAECEEVGAHLVVVLPHGLRRHLDAQLQPLVVSVGRPNALGVLRSHLRAHGLRTTAADLTVSEKLVSFIATASMRDIAWLAVRIDHGRTTKPSAGWSAWCEDAVKEMGDQSSDVAKLLNKHSECRPRALLLAAAMYSGTSVDVVHHAAQRLLKRLECEDPEAHPLVRPDFSRQLADVGGVSESGGVVRFDRWAQDEAVRLHFWRYFPDLRGEFITWAAEVGDTLLSPEQRLRVVERLAELCLRTDGQDELLAVVESWTGPNQSGLVAESIAALGRGACDERHGRAVRARLYHWAREGTLTPDRAQVVVQVCERVLVASYPNEALVRLHNLAVRGGVNGSDHARESMLQLAARERALYDQVIGRLCEALPKRADANLVMLAELLGPERSRDALRRRAWRRGWCHLMSRGDPTRWKPAVHLWLNALMRGSHAPGVLDDFVAAARRADCLTALYRTSYEWSRQSSTAKGAPQEARQTAARLWQKIDDAQGLSISVPGAASSRETV
ncbi:hypothetical protein [Streptomyces otsuchiensis]|uniref:hypothetical protein n=1 Tax=Streptomyces otsuchiensis TaxID=2681388 RepID=UPI00102FE4C5|nr:hypothetical protein [Streptomyces otsuchiensis]